MLFICVFKLKMIIKIKPKEYIVGNFEVELMVGIFVFLVTFNELC